MKRRKFLKTTGLVSAAGIISSRYPLIAMPARKRIVPDRNSGKATVSASGSLVTLENEYTALVFDRSTGTYSITAKSSGRICLAEAKMRINDWSSDDQDFRRTWKNHEISDALGEGMALDITLEKEKGPVIFFSFMLYHNYGFLKVAGGISNTSDKSIQIKEISAVSGGKLYPGTDVSENFAMIDGFSGGEPLEYGERMYSPLTRSNALKSRNNILLTFTNQNQREIAVLGGLTYTDFDKFAFIEQARRTELEKGSDGKSSLLCYLDLPSDKSDQKDHKEILRLEKGEDMQEWHYREFRCDELATSVKSPGEIIIVAENMDPLKKYTLGFSWWNGYWHGDHEDNHQSVLIEYSSGGRLNRIPLITDHVLPRFDGNKKDDAEQVELTLPAEAIRAGSFKIVVTKGAGTEKDENVYLSEIWLRDGAGKALLPGVLTQVKDCKRPRVSYSANLFAKDPVGKRVDPGTEYRPSDHFYIDMVSRDPFVALEDYGMRVSTAQGIELSMYDFPSVCLWYAENTEYGNNGAENSTPGAVKEMQIIKDSGFLRYSRAAVRLVPDSYMPDNQQGWWDDEHWQREVAKHAVDNGKHGRYLEPYETSEKWGRAVTELGGIPLTYFQTSYRSEDYAKEFPGHMLFNKTYAWKDGVKDIHGEIFTSWKNTWVRNGSVVWGYDYTDPEFLDHLTEVYRNLKKGNIKGLMFDYPSSGWAEDGGLEDHYSTTAAAYRNIFSYAADGLGPGAYVHERNMIRGSDITIGLVASMRTENDTDVMDNTTVTRCGLRWYKNRVLINQDTDSKNIARLQDNRDMVRAVLTMAYVVSGRLLLANSFSQFSPETMWDLSRTFPYHTEKKSARPADAFVSPTPMVYDFEVDPEWHQVTFYNPDADKGRKISIQISGEPVEGSLGLDDKKAYYAYDFWNDSFLGKMKGTDRLVQELRPGEARMISVREALDIPQVISTDRHIMQGYLDMGAIHWDPLTKTLTGSSQVIGDDPYIITFATNGYKGQDCSCDDPDTKRSLSGGTDGLLRLTLERPENKEVKWSVRFV